MKIVKEIIVPGGFARSFEASAGQFVKVIDMEGGQVADFFAFSRNDLKEHLSVGHSYITELSLRLYPGYKLRTNRKAPIFEVIEDTSKSVDMIMPACNKWRYLVDYGIKEHRNCIDNLEEVLKEYNLSDENYGNPLNIFQKTSITSDLKLEQLPCDSKAGDYLLLQCKMDVVGAVSACPMDVNAIAGNKITDIMIQILEE
ncbi:MAG: urea carboxylase-associated family protein [Tissierellaceae bacterium]|nr:urea carboxylase-associated family protein [Tissierellaceae bacterium]